MFFQARINDNKTKDSQLSFYQNKIKNERKIRNMENIEDIISKIKEAKREYYTGNPIMSDEEYDKLEEKAKKMGYKVKVGYKEKGEKVKLPIYLGTLNKVKDGNSERKLENWKENNGKYYYMEDKLDGITGLLEYGNEKIRIYTRGDHKNGKDISHISEYIKIPKVEEEILVRGEFIMSKKNFEKWCSLLNEERYNTARACVAGILNSKNIKNMEILRDIEFVAYELIPKTWEGEFRSDYKILKNSEQLKRLLQLGFNIVWNKRCGYEIDNTMLNNTLLERKSISEYEVDGLVLVSDDSYLYEERAPKYKIAYKISDKYNAKETIIRNVEWNLSHSGRLNPCVEFDPIMINGIKIQKATYHNANIIVKNGLNIGSRIMVTLANDVMPKIVEVLDKKEPLLPTVKYKWDEKKTFIYIDEKSEDLELKKIVNFFTKLNVKGFKKGTIKKVFDAGFNSIIKIVNMKYDDLISIDGIGDKKANSILHEISSTLENATLIDIAIASGLFVGFDRSRFNLLSQHIDILCDNVTVDSICEIHGFQKITASKFIDNISEFKKFISQFQHKFKHKKPKHYPEESCNNISICMSGVRDKQIIEFVEKQNGKIYNTMPKIKPVTYLVVKDPNSMSQKIKIAKSKNVPILSVDEFKAKFSI